MELSFFEEISDILNDYLSQNVILRFTAYVPDSFVGPSRAMIDNISLIIEEQDLSTTNNELINNEIKI